MITNSPTRICSIDISKYLNCSKVYVSKIIDLLIKKELITKKKSLDDGRQYYLYATIKGKELVKEYMDKYMETTKYLYDKLGVEKSKNLIDLLQESTKILNEYERLKK